MRHHNRCLKCPYQYLPKSTQDTQSSDFEPFTAEQQLQKERLDKFYSLIGYTNPFELPEFTEDEYKAIEYIENNERIPDDLLYSIIEAKQQRELATHTEVEERLMKEIRHYKRKRFIKSMLSVLVVCTAVFVAHKHIDK